MISGQIDERYGMPVVDIEIQANDGKFHRKTAILDTGCNQELLVPGSLMDELGIAPSGDTVLNSATERGNIVATYHLKVRWRGDEIDVEAGETVTPLILGMGLCDGMKIVIEMRQGGRVWLEEIISTPHGLETP